VRESISIGVLFNMGAQHLNPSIHVLSDELVSLLRRVYCPPFKSAPHALARTHTVKMTLDNMIGTAEVYKIQSFRMLEISSAPSTVNNAKTHDFVYCCLSPLATTNRSYSLSRITTV
jgi:hypothetical protein